MEEKEMIELVKEHGRLNARMKHHPEFGEWRIIIMDGYLTAVGERGSVIITDPDDWEIL